MRETIAKFTGLSFFKRLRIIACVGIVVFMIGVVFTEQLALEKGSREYDANEQQIHQLNAQLREAKSVEPDSGEVVKKAILSCKKQGNAVAKYQNAYQGLTKDADIADNAKKLSIYFGKDSDSQTPWFSYGNHKWSFRTNYTFDAKLIPVLWTCEDPGTGELLAYATGEYNSEENIFANVETSTTSIGNARIEGTPHN